MIRFQHGVTMLLLIVLASGGALPFMVAAPASADSTPAAAPYTPTIDPAAFVSTIDNRYFPLRPGTTFVYEGTKDGERQRNEVTVTSETKMILGVRCVTVRDRVTAAGRLVEETLDWYAQDRAGNVWYFGEASKAYDNGKVSTEGSWEGGVDGAKPGIVMQAAPRPGAPYRQEYLKGEAEDMAQVLRVDGRVTVPFGSFGNVLVTKEWSPLDPGIEEEKSYAPGVGMVLAKSVKGEHEQSALVALTGPGQATPAATPAG